jgi:hypothetical protein
MSSVETSPPEIVTSRYSLSIEDVLAFNRHFAFTRNRHLRHRLWFAAALWAFLTGFAYAWITVQRLHDLKRGIVVGVLAAVLFLPVYWFAVRYAHGRQIRHIFESEPDDHQTGFRALGLTESGIREETARTETLIRWHAVRSIACTSDYWFIYYGTLAAIIVPRAAITPALAAALRARVAPNLFTGSGLPAA